MHISLYWTTVFISVCSRLCLDESYEDSLAISAAQREKKLLNGMIQNLLPAVGSFVRSIVLAYSSTVSSKMVSTRNLCTQALLVL